MKKPVIIGVVVLVIILAVGGILLAQNNSDDSKTDTTSSSDTSTMDMSTPPPSDTSTTEPTTPAATNSVEIKDYAFSPANITVKVGTKVTWTNQDSIGHTVTDDDGSDGGMDSQLLQKGESYSVTFTKAGTFAYHCTPHTYMKGTVTVTE